MAKIHRHVFENPGYKEKYAKTDLEKQRPLKSSFCPPPAPHPQDFANRSFSSQFLSHAHRFFFRSPQSDGIIKSYDTYSYSHKVILPTAFYHMQQETKPH